MTDFAMYPASALRDPEALRGLLEQHVLVPGTNEVIAREVDDIIESVAGSAGAPGEGYYVVAMSAGRATLGGMMGLQRPTESIYESVIDGDDVVLEVVHAFVDKGLQHVGIGSALLRHLESVAKELGATKLVVSSGARYKDSGWPFWDSKFTAGPTIANHYGEGWDARVWWKSLGS